MMKSQRQLFWVGIALMSALVVLTLCNSRLSELMIDRAERIADEILFGNRPVWSRSSWPGELQEFQDHLPEESNNQIRAIKVYRLEQFIDSSFIWRIDGPPEVFEQLKKFFKLDVVTKDEVSPSFYDMPPRWWNPKLNDDVAIASSLGFTAEERGSDGLYLFVVYDPSDEIMYVWSKNNF